jgi:hypothetical protein
LDDSVNLENGKGGETLALSGEKSKGAKRRSIRSWNRRKDSFGNLLSMRI